MTSRILALASAASLAWAVPAAAQQQPGQQTQQPGGGQMGGQQMPRPGGGRMGGQPISQQDLQKYVQALQQMGQAEPQINQALRQGRPVETDVLNRVPQQQADRAIKQAGISSNQFRRITERIPRNPQLLRQYQRVARQQMQQTGGGQTGGGRQQPGPSPQ